MFRVRSTCVVLAVALLPALRVCAAPGPATAPAVPSADEFLKQLSTDDWRQRRQTLRQLVELGPEAEPLLRDLLSRDLDHEARKNVELAAEQIRENRLLGPTLVTLHVKDSPPGPVFAELARQCGGPLTTWPEKLWEQPTWPKLTLDYDHRPFWEVIAQISKRLEVDYISTEPQELRIARDSGHSPGGTCVSGAFLLTADPVTFRNGMNIELSIYAEPKVVVTRAISFKLDVAEDDKGTKLLPQTSRRFWGRRYRTGSRQLPMIFQRLQEEATRVGRFKGTVTVAIQSESETWVVDDPLSMSPATRLVDTLPVTLESFTATHNSEGYELLVAVPNGWSSRGAQDEMIELIKSRMKVLDAKGHALTLSSTEGRSLNDGSEITVTLTPTILDDGSKTGAPAKLTWDIPSRTRTLVVPFDFKDLPVNDPFN